MKSYLIRIAKSIFIGFFALSFVACKKKNNDSGNTPTPKGNSVSPLNTEPLKLSYQAIPFKPNSYTVTLDINQIWPKIMIYTNNNHYAYTRMQTITIPEESKDLGQKITVELIDSNNETQLKTELKINAPKDFIFNSKTYLSDDTQIELPEGRIFLNSQAQIITHEFDLTLIAKEIIIETVASITNYESDVADREKDGRSGGTVKIQAQTATGLLQIHSNSEAGGRGKDGWNPSLPFNQTLCNPTSGGNAGKMGRYFIRIEDSSNISLAPHMEKPPGGQPGTIDRGFSPNLKTTNTQNCDHAYFEGQPGYGGLICVYVEKNKNNECLTSE